MKLVEALSAVLAFRSIPTTILLLLFYLTVFGSVFITDNLPAVPKNTRGLDLAQAYSDLHQVRLLFHRGIPYLISILDYPQTPSLQFALQRTRSLLHSISAP